MTVTGPMQCECHHHQLARKTVLFDAYANILTIEVSTMVQMMETSFIPDCVRRCLWRGSFTTDGVPRENCRHIAATGSEFGPGQPCKGLHINDLLNVTMQSGETSRSGALRSDVTKLLTYASSAECRC